MRHWQSFRAIFIGSLLAVGAATIVATAWLLVPLYRDYRLAEQLRTMNTDLNSLEFGRKISGMAERGEGGPYVIAMLIQGTKDTDKLIRQRCTGALANYAVARRYVYPELISALADENKFVRSRVWAELQQIPDLSVPPIVAALSSPDPRLRAGALEALGSFRGTGAAIALPAVLSHVSDDDALVREYAIWALGSMAPADDEAVTERIIHAFDDPAAPVRREAAKAVANRKVNDAAPLIRAMLGDDPELRWLSYSIHQQSQVVQVVTALIAALNDQRQDVRVNVICAFGRMGPNGSAAVPQLYELLNDDDRKVRFPAARSIFQITGECDKVMPTVIATLQDPADPWHWAALDEIVTIGAGAEAMRTLTDVLRQSTEPSSLHVISAIRRIAAYPELAVPALVEALDYQKPQQCLDAIAALKEFGSDAKPALPALNSLLKRPEFRGAAQAAINAIQSQADEAP